MKMLSKLSLVVAGFTIFAGAASAEMIQVKGSDTIINLVQKEAEVYMQQNPGAKISVTGGGSGTGIAALINRQCTIADASRAINAKEVEMATGNGVNPSRIVIAFDALSIVVNSNNSVKQLTKKQVGAIYRGEIKNWSEVGGPDMPINLYGRQSNSGTYGFLQEEVLKGNYSPKMNSMNGNSQIVEGVKADPSAIGYIGIGYAKQATGVTILDINMSDGQPAISPVDKSAVMSGKYPIARPLYQYVDGNPSGTVKAFIQFELSPEGQKIVEDEGFYEIPAEYKEANAKFGL
ncbi:MAG: PstS family phosphate ABC transporter substrate-binding protein [Candidatus Omnitrophica bacterium]|nr:PstS family phosphate ABC transporter substrate-binding protein [Candidatus Omnitrophota bacterium]